MKILLIASLLFFISSCTKNTDTDNTTISNNYKVKTITNAKGITVFTYDNEGRVILKVRDEGTYVYKSEYIYSPGQIKLITSFNGHFDPENTLYLNQDGTVAQAKYPASKIEVLYKYNADKSEAQEIQIRDTDTSVANFFWKDNRIDSSRYTDLKGNWRSTVILTFYMDQPKTYFFPYEGLFYIGKDNDRMIKSRHIRTAGTLIFHDDFTYENDTQGRLIKKTDTDINGVATTETYTYY